MHFSIVIPTMWRSDKTEKLLEDLQASKFVKEIVIIDNDYKNKNIELDRFDKIVYLKQDQNVYVNPAWNIGVNEASCELVSICNDDINFNVDEVLEYVYEYRMALGVFGMHKEAYNGPCDETFATKVIKNVDFEVALQVGHFGALMFINKNNWIDIPTNLRIWYGDNWIGYTNLPIFEIRPKSGVITDKHVTSSDTGFNPVIDQDRKVWANIRKIINNRLK